MTDSYKNKHLEIEETDTEDFKPVKQDTEEEKAAKKEKEALNLPKGTRRFELSRGVRCLVYFVFCLCNVATELDDGVISACPECVKENMEITDTDVGLIESSTFLGCIFGSALGIPLLNIISRKWIMVGACLIMAGLSTNYQFNRNLWICILFRFLLGFTKSFINVYLPLWIDQYGMEGKKTLMLSFIQLAPIIGSCVGLGITKVFVETTFPWEIESGERDKGKYSLAIYVMTGVLGLAGLILAFFPKKYFFRDTKKISHDALVLVNFRPSFIGNRTSILNETQNGFRPSYKGSVFYGTGDDPQIEEDVVGDEEQQRKTSMDEKVDAATGVKPLQEKDIPLCQKCGLVCKDPLFLLASISCGFYSFATGAFAYWAPDYMNIALRVDDPNQIIIAITLATVPVPVIASILAGIIIDCLGGYINKRAMLICSLASIIIAGISLLICFLNGILPFSITLGALMFFITLVFPPLTGIIISDIRNIVKGFGTGLYQLIYNLLGFLPAPLTYGALKDLMIGLEQKGYNKSELYYNGDRFNRTELGWETEGNGSRYAMLLTMSVSVIGAILMIIATCIRYKKAEYYDELMKTGVEPGTEEDENEENEADDQIQLVDQRRRLVSQSGQSFS